jgi:ribonuclease P protein component
MGFARAWRRKAARRSFRRGVRAAVNASVPEQNAHSVIVERLKRRSDFRAVANGVRTSGRAFALQARRRDENGAPRVGFTVSRQVGNAVERNRVRRRLREVVRMSAALGSEGLCPGHDYVLVGRRAALAAPFSEMMRDLTAALSGSRDKAAAEVLSAGRRGTGGDRPDPLHEAGSPSRRRGVQKPPSTSSPKALSPRPQER